MPTSTIPDCSNNQYLSNVRPTGRSISKGFTDLLLNFTSKETERTGKERTKNRMENTHCISLQTDNHTSTPPVFYRPDALPATQPTASKHSRQEWKTMQEM